MHDDPRPAYLRATTLTDQRASELLARLPGRRAPSARPVWPVAALACAAAALVALWAWPKDGPAELPLPYVTLDQQGQGQVGGTRLHPRITWESGTLQVEVEPGRGVDLVVSTPEAQVSVVGTAFTVDRKFHATEVAVSHGNVRLMCTGETATPISGGQRRTCLPNDAPTLLVRLAELTDAGAPAEERLISADRGLATNPAPELRRELLAHRVGALRDADHADEALAAAEEYLQIGGGPRRAALLSYVARTRYDRERCAAETALERAVAELPPGPERVLLAACVLQRDPRRAGELVDGADGWAQGEWLRLATQIRASAR